MRTSIILRILIALSALAVLLVLACNSFAGVVEDNNAFAFDLYKNIASDNKGGNIVMSPFGVSTALAMTYAGARGETEKQIASTLHTSLQKDDFHAEYSSLLGKLTGTGELYTLTVLNSLWGQKGDSFQKEFLDIADRYYGGGFRKTDFMNDPGGSVNAINDWVYWGTRGKISNLLHKSEITRDTRLIILDAVFFKGKWVSQFKKDNNIVAPFFVTPEKKIDATMMRKKMYSNYCEDDNVQVLELPYKGNMSMIVLLPKQMDGLSGLESALSADKIDDWTANSSTHEIELSMPKFKYTFNTSLIEPLTSMGMKDAFDANADFSGINGKKDLFISEALHNTIISVDEEGTEAAAVTMLKMGRMSSGPGPEPVVFNADHPFMFLIMHRPTGAILFMGRVTNPGK